MSMVANLRTKQISTSTAAWSIIALVCMAGGTIYAIQQKLTHATVHAVHHQVASASEAAVAPDPVAVAQADTAVKSTKDAAPVNNDGYAIIAERNLFKSMDAPPPMKSSATVTPSSIQPASVPPVVISPGNWAAMRGARRGDDTAHTIAFTGVVTTPAGVKALLENTITKETQYAAVGDTAFDCYVSDITYDAVTLMKDGTTISLALGENKVADTSKTTAPAASPTPTAASPTPAATPQTTDTTNLNMRGSRRFGGNGGRMGNGGGTGGPGGPQ